MDMSNNSKRQRVDETVKVESNDVVSKIPQCPGHNQKCKMSEVRTKGDNYSRWFFMCSLPRPKQCKFFKVSVGIFCDQISSFLGRRSRISIEIDFTDWE